MTRHRNRNREPTSSTYKKLLNGSAFDSLDTVMTDHQEFMDDVVTPRFSTRIARGEVINNPCQYVKYDYRAGFGSYSATGPGYSYTASGGSQTKYSLVRFGVDGWDSLPVVTTQLALAQQVSRLGALKNIDPTPLSMLEDVAEIRSTLQLLQKPFSSLKRLSFSFLRAVKRRQGSGEDLTEAIANVWLTYRFGFSPVIRSAIDVIDNYNVKPKKRKDRMISRGFGKDTGSLPENLEVIHSSTNKSTFRRFQRWDLDVSSGILYQVTNPVEGFRFKYGLRASDIPETIWAVMPYSFLVDRVINISDSIRALTNLADPRVVHLAAWTRSKIELHNLVKHLDQVDGVSAISVHGDDVTRDYFEYVRSPYVPSALDTIPVPTPTGLVDSATNAIDVLSLVISNLRGRR